ncbi:MAG: acetylserotonin O-methyltransferase [Gammaproteobacteria bacterium]|nr:acetylserotonin O-methyltransferase [Gammaproteobacteria bacterium]
MSTAANLKNVPPPTDPSRIIALSTAYWGSQVLLTANRLRVFDALANGPQSATALAEQLGLDGRMTALFMNACVGLGLCEKVDGRYLNARVSDVFLRAGSPASMQNSMSFMDDLYATWGDLEHALRSGQPAKAAVTYLGNDEEQTRHFVYSMHDRAMAIGQALPQVVDLTGRQRMLDVGGGPGTFSALLTRRYEGLRSDVLELDGVASVAEEILDDLGVGDRVAMIRGDYHTSDFGSGYDVVLMSGMFHRETAEACKRLIDQARDCLEPGGMLIVNDVFTDEGGTTPEFSALFGITMMLTAADGCVHADANVDAWMNAAGFVDTLRRPFPPPMPHRVVTGIRS